MSKTETSTLEKLQCAFSNLTEANQFYVLGLIEGLNHAQSKNKDTAAPPKIDAHVSGKTPE